jgi:hypothetical protein
LLIEKEALMSQHDESPAIPVESTVFPHYDHTPMHRLWAFTTLQSDLTLPEELHVLECEQCRQGLMTCFSAQNFGAVLKDLKKEGDSAA